MRCRLLAVALLLATPLQAQQTARVVPLARAIGTFLVDSGVRTTGLPWTTGADLPIRWESAGPVQNQDQWARGRGLTHTRTGSMRVSLGDSVTLPVTVTLYGIAGGLARTMFRFESMLVEQPGGGGFFVTRHMVEEALRNDGMMLQPIKCSRDTEGASYGNLVDAAKVPGKTASGLWWFWQSVQQELEVSLTILYRRADLAEVECQGN
ncbi:MAG TPA: hypothetical protein PLL69_00645 [Gemmatimonadales bacterium]|nr:hypothetical protein [Gemmatimonadales bacterium]